MERRNGSDARLKEVPRPPQSIDCREKTEVRFTGGFMKRSVRTKGIRLSGENETNCINNDIKKSYAGF